MSATADQLQTDGFCVLERLYDEGACARARDLIDGFWRAAGRPALAGQGFGIHPALTKIPAMRPLFANEIVFRTIAEAMGVEPMLVRAGARISDERCDATLVRWHQHYHWPPERVLHRRHIERVLSVAYPDGTSDAVGNLVIMPRTLNEPIKPHSPRDANWPGQVVLQLPPGSVAIFDSATWHMARSGLSPGRRRLFGGHYQAADVHDAHPDDIPGDRSTLWELAAG